ncbi:hypothetical protein [Imhoffiella purpurea]|nr:hypothetical protein [Imhoffiella purpurea]
MTHLGDRIGLVGLAGVFVLAGALAWIGGDSRADESVVDLSDPRIGNLTAYISAQCYTRTEDDSGRVSNPCFTCHTRGRIPTYLDDHDLQLSYSLPGDALANPWTNLQVDRSARVAAIGDAAILDYVRTDNYRDAQGRPILAETLTRDLPDTWDLDGNGQWDGYVPDAYFDFDEAGFDRTPDGGYSGWRAFGYHPFPGTFWPTNGSTDDVLIRLPAVFQRNADGRFDLSIYRVNLAIVESLVRRRDVRLDPVDEIAVGLDLDDDGILGEATRLVFDWAPLEGRSMSYAGQAGALQSKGELHLAAGLFPEGTEFLHSVRYIDLDEAGAVRLAARMKELRYARKNAWYSYAELKGINDREGAERALDPDILKSVPGDFERGMFTQGWVYQGFIEDGQGSLRPQSQEETLFCMGCHGGIGATTDTIFSFPRRLGYETYRHGWFHWSQHGLAGIPEPRLEDGSYEYSRYLEINGAGDEFRANTEVMERFFDADGNLLPERIQALHEDMGTLLLPSAERALTLDKAYRVIVEEQSFIRGRDATVEPPLNVHESLIQNQATGVEEPSF